MKRDTLARASIREVAQTAGVSVATVSRVLNDLPNVNPETRAKILAIAASMNYVRHGAARALSSRRSQTIGLIVPLLGTAVFAEAVRAIEEQLREDKYYLLTASSGYDPDKEFEVARAMVERGVDGLIVVGATHAPAFHAMLEQAGVPAVQTFVLDPASALPCVGFDNYAPAYELTQHLIDLGHRQFAVLHGGLKSNDRITARYEAITDCLRVNGIPLDARLAVHAGETIASGREGFARLLATGAPFTALCCTGDVLAVGVLIEARHRKVKVPQQVSVTGFHDLELAAHTDPPLTTVHAPIAEMARAASRHLLAQINDGDPAPPSALPTSVILRKSVGPAPGRKRE